MGTGSAGVRHIQNLLALGAEVYAYSYRKDRAAFIGKEYGVKVFTSLEDALNYGHRAVIISNRTDQHIDVALAAAQRGLNIYIEKPLSNHTKGVYELQRIIKSKHLVIEVGCMLRFHPNLVMIKKILSEEAVGQNYFTRACVGQYLPSWRPGHDYRQSYSAKKEQGGGVVFDLIHELDYLIWWHGYVKEVSAFLDHVSDLEINTEDIAQILLRFKNGHVAQVHMDYLRPFYHRSCEIVGSKGVITWDYLTGAVSLAVNGSDNLVTYSTPNGYERNSMFFDHMKHFLKQIQEGANPAVCLDDSVHILHVALAAHRSSIEGRVIKI